MALAGLDIWTTGVNAMNGDPEGNVVPLAGTPRLSLAGLAGTERGADVGPDLRCPPGGRRRERRRRTGNQVAGHLQPARHLNLGGRGHQPLT